MPTDLFTMNYLGTFAGLVAATFLLVSFFKEKVKVLGDWYVRLFAVMVALAIQVFVFYVNGALTVAAVGTAFLNAFLVAMAAAGAYNFSKPPDSSIAPPTAASGDISSEAKAAEATTEQTY